MNILLTGGSGFIGSSFKEWFSIHTDYSVFTPSHKELDLLKIEDVKKYITQYKIDNVIHAACIGARRYKRNTIEDVYTNLLMYENLIVSAKQCNKFIGFGSGGEFDLTNHITNRSEEDIFNIVPLEYGGFLKSLVSKRLITTYTPDCYNLRFFGGFYSLEANDRFIKGCILNILQNKPIIIHQDRWFDFIYTDDLALIANYILTTSVKIPKDINCVYQQKYTLLDIAKLILNITKSNIDITIEQDGLGLDYTGNGEKLESLQLPLLGLEEGIKKTWNILKENYNAV